MDLIKITPDLGKAKNILRMTSLIEERIQLQDRERMVALIITDYYEIIKELITALLLIDGYKTLSHKDLITYLEENYSEFKTNEIATLNNLRILRNRVAYEGLFIDSSHLERNENLLRDIIKKLGDVIERK